MKYVCKRLAAMVMVLICLTAMLAIPASAKTDLPTVISQAKEGVVKLFVVGFSPDGPPAAAAVGSGFAVGQKGSTPEYFVTNWHVASAYLSEYNYAFDSDHVRIWIMLDNFTISDVTDLPSEATSVECSIVRIAESGYPDYAILKAARPVTECKPLAIRSSESVKQGETVVALGCPAVVDDLSATVGSNDITATRGTVARHMVMSAAGNTNVLLHDAVISGGNSGGPLIDENGNDVPLWSDGISAGNGSDVQRGVDFLQRDRFLPMVYAYLYSQEMLDANSLRMAPIWHEDEEFTPRALYYARRIQYLPVRVYNYLQRSDSFMGNYKPQSRLDLVRAMKSLTCFASRIGAEDPSGARLMRLHVGKTLSLACKQTVVRQLGNAREMLREARRLGIMPLEFRRRDFRHFLINRLPGLYVLYYKLHKRQK